MKDQCSASLENSEDGWELGIPFSPVHLGFDSGQTLFVSVQGGSLSPPTFLLWSTEDGPHIKD